MDLMGLWERAAELSPLTEKRMREKSSAFVDARFCPCRSNARRAFGSVTKSSPAAHDPRSRLDQPCSGASWMERDGRWTTRARIARARAGRFFPKPRFPFRELPFTIPSDAAYARSMVSLPADRGSASGFLAAA